MQQMKRVRLAFMAACLICLCLIFAAQASAADRSACSEDIAKFCQNIEPGMIALMDCLEKHENELTEACKARESAMGKGKSEGRERVREWSRFREACRSDMAQFCNDANPTQGGMMKCLNDHEKEISASCSASIKMIVE